MPIRSARGGARRTIACGFGQSVACHGRCILAVDRTRGLQEAVHGRGHGRVPARPQDQRGAPGSRRRTGCPREVRFFTCFEIILTRFARDFSPPPRDFSPPPWDAQAAQRNLRLYGHVWPSPAADVWLDTPTSVQVRCRAHRRRFRTTTRVAMAMRPAGVCRRAPRRTRRRLWPSSRCRSRHDRPGHAGQAAIPGRSKENGGWFSTIVRHRLPLSSGPLGIAYGWLQLGRLVAWP